MSTLLYLVGAIGFLAAIMASIGLHELGHMIPAKAFGGKVTQYFIGFGPTVWSRKRGETEYGLKAIPLGGYVKIVGMLPPGSEQLADEVTYDGQGNQVLKIRKSNTGMFTQLISDARAAEWETITTADSDRLFYKMPWWKKVIVMAGGPSVNILIAFVLYLLIFSLHGNEADVRTDSPVTVADVPACIVPAAENGRECKPTDKPSPAVDAGLRKGDVITSFNGVAITSYDQLRDLIRDNESGEAAIGYTRDGVADVGNTNTTVELVPESETDDTLTQHGYLGISPEVHIATGGPLYTVEQMGHMSVETVKALGSLPVKVWGVAKAIVGVEDRAADSPVSIVGGGRIAGEVVSSDSITGDNKLLFFAGLVAGFNFFIGMFNFIPLLPLDGGHIASALWEAVRRGWAKLTRRPDPGYVDAAKLLPVAYVVASVMLVLGMVLIVGDLVVPLHLES